MALLAAIGATTRARGRIAAAGTAGFRRGVAFLGLALWLLGPAAGGVRAAPAPSREYQIKAVFLYNFVQFVDWPAKAFAGPDEPIRIGILGDDPFGPAIDEAVRGESVRSRPLVVIRARSLEELADCQLIFFAKSEGRDVAEQIARLGGRPVLMVGDDPDFARRGGAIAFYPEGKRIRFEINVEVARRLGLKMSSELLELGKIVGDASAPGKA